MIKIPFSLSPSTMSFRFVNTTHKSVGILVLRMPTSTFGHIQFLIDIVDLDVPMKLGFPDIRTNNLLMYYLDNTLVNKTYS